MKHELEKKDLKRKIRNRKGSKLVAHKRPSNLAEIQQRGDMTERKFEQACAELLAEKAIDGFTQTTKFDNDDKQGIDFWIIYGGNRVPFQVKSSKARAELFERENPHIPVVYNHTIQKMKGWIEQKTVAYLLKEQEETIQAAPTYRIEKPLSRNINPKVDLVKQNAKNARDNGLSTRHVILKPTSEEKQLMENQTTYKKFNQQEEIEIMAALMPNGRMPHFEAQRLADKFGRKEQSIYDKTRALKKKYKTQHAKNNHVPTKPVKKPVKKRKKEKVLFQIVLPHWAVCAFCALTVIAGLLLAGVVRIGGV